MRQACQAKTRASGKDRAMSGEEEKWHIKNFGKRPPRECYVVEERVTCDSI